MFRSTKRRKIIPKQQGFAALVQTGVGRHLLSFLKQDEVAKIACVSSQFNKASESILHRAWFKQIELFLHAINNNDGEPHLLKKFRIKFPQGTLPQLCDFVDKFLLKYCKGLTGDLKNSDHITVPTGLLIRPAGLREFFSQDLQRVLLKIERLLSIKLFYRTGQVGNDDIVRNLLLGGANCIWQMDHHGKTALDLSIDSPTHWRFMLPLIDPNLIISGYSLLMHVITRKNIDMAEELLNRGASIHYISPNGSTALHEAVKWTYETKIVERILKMDPTLINNVTQDLNTPLLIALDRRNHSIVDFIFKNFISLIDVNHVNSNGHTALGVAVANGCYEACEFLLDHKADLLIKDNQGKTILDNEFYKRRLEEQGLIEKPGCWTRLMRNFS